jgi:MFS family permease
VTAIRKPLLVLFPLYFAQGMPYGFQATALPVYLRERGVSLSAIGFAGLLSLPWALKALWAPLVDRYGGGKYKPWILPLQLLLGLTTALAAYIPTEGGTPYLLGAVFLMNLFAATQDIAVDGLAVRTLTPEELGPANAIQVVGYKVGMLTGGGLLVWLSGNVGWRVVFMGMAALMCVVFVLTALLAEEGSRPAEAHVQLQVILRQLVRAAKAGGVLLLVVIASAKIGEQMVETMWKPFLVDSGFTKVEIGLWQGTYGMAASIAGSLFGALVCKKLPLPRALFVAAILRVPGLLGQVWMTQTTPTGELVIAVTLVEHFFVGLMTTALFAYMMSRVDPRIGATHYTLLASVEVLGKSPGSLSSGVLAERIGYFGTFAIGSALSLAFVLLVWIANRAFAARALSTAAAERV